MFLAARNALAEATLLRSVANHGGIRGAASGASAALNSSSCGPAPGSAEIPGSSLGRPTGVPAARHRAHYQEVDVQSVCHCLTVVGFAGPLGRNRWERFGV